MTVQTEFEFTLPKGFIDEKEQVHRNGRMRLATVYDEVESIENPAELWQFKGNAPCAADVPIWPVLPARCGIAFWTLPAISCYQPPRNRGDQDE